ncbi:MAG TPA: ankyrin repeat domain-containing protein [Planctomycetia bacterium]|nr:ankyrin repeat domain-containing protein [Planctomycetia bacterium]
MRRGFAVVIAWAIALSWGSGGASAQTAAKVDFGRDIQPLFQAHCVECHGPKQQKNGFRLDRRRDAMRGGTAVMIGPGASAASKLYLRLVGDRYGRQMPLDGPLSREQIEVVKAWIDQGAHWPDALAGESSAATPDPGATRPMEALRQGDRAAFEKMLQADPKLARLRGAGGTTPLMQAALYGDAESVRRLLERGADPDARNESGATALMWAVDDVEKLRLLLKAGAKVNARSDDGRTALLIAAGWVGAGDAVKLLLDHGADPAASAYGIRGGASLLRMAADAEDAAFLRSLVERGVKPKGEGIVPLVTAINANNAQGVELLIAAADRGAVKPALLSVVPPRAGPSGQAGARLIRKLVEHGADVNARDADGRTVLMLAASSDRISPEAIQMLVDRGADARAAAPDGRTATDFASWRGKSPVADLLKKAGAGEGSAPVSATLKPKAADSVRAALSRSIPLLQRTDATFLQKAGCVSCHNNSLTAETVAMARKGGIPVDEPLARKQLSAIAAYAENWRERRLQGIGGGGEAATVSAVLAGMAAEGHPPDPATEAWARYLLSRQSRDGSWRAPSERPPLESSGFQITALSLRSLQAYGPKARRAEYDKAVERAADWLRKNSPESTVDRAFQLIGRGWAGDPKETLGKAAQDLLSEQREDGGWAQLPGLASDAFATGLALTALREAGALAASDSAYQRGVRYLLDTQLEDGSWYVRSRSIPIQPHFESGFPHGRDQWISVAATNWAAMALIPAAR